MTGIGMMPWRGALTASTAALLGSLALAGAASAANTCNVNDQRDLPQATVGAPASTGGAGDFTLRSCVAWANQNGGATSIVLPAGTYPINAASGSPTDLTNGDFKVNTTNNSTAITVTGAGSGVSVINAQGNSPGFTVFQNGSLTL